MSARRVAEHPHPSGAVSVSRLRLPRHRCGRPTDSSIDFNSGPVIVSVISTGGLMKGGVYRYTGIWKKHRRNDRKEAMTLRRYLGGIWVLSGQMVGCFCRQLARSVGTEVDFNGLDWAMNYRVAALTDELPCLLVG